MLTAKDVERVRFGAATLRRGYDQREVDDLLERVAATLRAVEEGRSPDAVPGGALSGDDLDHAVFTSTFRGGYDEREVDTFLDRVSATLRHYGHDSALLRPVASPPASPLASPPAGSTTPGTSAPSPVETRPGLVARVVRFLRGE